MVEELAQIKSKLRSAKSEFSHINANLDDIEYINGFLVKAGFNDTITRVNFLKALLEARQVAYESSVFPGVSHQAVDDLLYSSSYVYL